MQRIGLCPIGDLCIAIELPGSVSRIAHLDLQITVFRCVLRQAREIGQIRIADQDHIHARDRGNLERIVEKLDRAFEEIDRAIAATDECVRNYSDFYASAIKDVYFGNSKAKIVQLGEIAKIKGGKRIPKGKKLTTEITNYPYIRVSDFTDDGTVDEDSIQFITEDIKKQILRYTISSADVYVSIAGTIGKTGVIPESLDGANLTENAAKIVLDGRCLRDYFYYFTTSASFKEQAISQTRTAALLKCT